MKEMETLTTLNHDKGLDTHDQKELKNETLSLNNTGDFFDMDINVPSCGDRIVDRLLKFKARRLKSHQRDNRMKAPSLDNFDLDHGTKKIS